MHLCCYFRVVLATRVFGEPNFIQCVCFDSKGEYISKLASRLNS